MPDLDRLFAPSRPNTPPAFGASQAWEARVSRINQRGLFVVIPGYDRNLEWGPCLPPGASANVGETVTVAMTNRRPAVAARRRRTATDTAQRSTWAT